MRDPGDSTSRYAIALEHKGSGNTEEAMAILRELTLSEPPFIPAYHELGLLYVKLDRTPEAKEIYRRGIDLALKAGETKELSAMREELEELEDEW